MEKGNHFFAHGKLLLTAEYVVLDGALAIALPTQYGQEMHITPSEREGIFFRSLTQEGTPKPRECNLTSLQANQYT